jgi:hypothetical protein
VSVSIHATQPSSAPALFALESLGQALRQLEFHGRDGLPVLSADGHQIQGWVTCGSVHASPRPRNLRADGEAGQDQAAANLIPAPQNPPPRTRTAQVASNPAPQRGAHPVAWIRRCIARTPASDNVVFASESQPIMPGPVTTPRNEYAT